MENTSLYDVVESLVVLLLVGRLFFENRRLRRENENFMQLISELLKEDREGFWKRYRDTAPKK